MTNIILAFPLHNDEWAEVKKYCEQGIRSFCFLFCSFHILRDNINAAIKYIFSFKYCYIYVVSWTHYKDFFWVLCLTLQISWNLHKIGKWACCIPEYVFKNIQVVDFPCNIYLYILNRILKWKKFRIALFHIELNKLFRIQLGKWANGIGPWNTRTDFLLWKYLVFLRLMSHCLTCFFLALNQEWEPTYPCHLKLKTCFYISCIEYY